MSPLTFAQAYCRRHQIPEDRFEQVVVARALYPHARLLRPLIVALRPDHFVADHDLVRGAGRLRRLRDFTMEVSDFLYNPANSGTLRRLGRLRVSTQRLRRLVQETLHDPANVAPPEDGSAMPFVSVKPPASGKKAGSRQPSGFRPSQPKG